MNVFQVIRVVELLARLMVTGQKTIFKRGMLYLLIFTDTGFNLLWFCQDKRQTLPLPYTWDKPPWLEPD